MNHDKMTPEQFEQWIRIINLNKVRREQWKQRSDKSILAKDEQSSFSKKDQTEVGSEKSFQASSETSQSLSRNELSKMLIEDYLSKKQSKGSDSSRSSKND